MKYKTTFKNSKDVSEFISVVRKECKEKFGAYGYTPTNYTLNDATADAVANFHKDHGRWPKMHEFLHYTSLYLAIYGKFSAYFSIDYNNKLGHFFAQLSSISHPNQEKFIQNVNRLWNRIAQTIQVHGTEDSRWRKQWIKEGHQDKNLYSQICLHPNNFSYRQHKNKMPEYIYLVDNQETENLEKSAEHFQLAEDILKSGEAIVRYDLALKQYEEAARGSGGNRYFDKLSNFREKYPVLLQKMYKSFLKEGKIKELVDLLYEAITEKIEFAYFLDNSHHLAPFWDIFNSLSELDVSQYDKWCLMKYCKDQNHNPIDLDAETQLLDYYHISEDKEKISFVLTAFYYCHSNEESTKQYFEAWLKTHQVNSLTCYMFALISDLEWGEHNKLADIQRFTELRKKSEKQEDCCDVLYCHSDYYIIAQLYIDEGEYNQAIDILNFGLPYADDDYHFREIYPLLLHLYYNITKDFVKAKEVAVTIANDFLEHKIIDYADFTAYDYSYSLDGNDNIKRNNGILVLLKILLLFKENEIADKLTSLMRKTDLKSNILVDIPWLLFAYSNYLKSNHAGMEKFFNHYMQNPPLLNVWELRSQYENASKKKEYQKIAKEIKREGDDFDTFIYLADSLELGFVFYGIQKFWPKIKRFKFYRDNHLILKAICQKLSKCIRSKMSVNFTDEEKDEFYKVFKCTRQFKFVENNLEISQHNIYSLIWPVFLKEFIGYLYRNLDLEYRELSEQNIYKRRVLDNLNTLFQWTSNQLIICLEIERSKEALMHQKQVSNAKLAERDAILSDLSHNIKNLLGASVISPLEDLVRSNEEFKDSYTINYALRGAELIRRMIQAINLSSAGSLEDFVYDATHQDSSSQPMESIVYNAILFSLGNIFVEDFGKFQDGYVVNHDLFHVAKEKFKSLKNQDFDQLKAYCREYLLELDIDLKGLAKLTMSDEKSSATKLLILFQEIILNAVKYSSFVDRDQRYIKISISIDKGQFVIDIANSASSKTKAKSTGLGHMIIEKMAGLFKADYMVIEDVDKYSVKLIMPNLWKSKPSSAQQT